MRRLTLTLLLCFAILVIDIIPLVTPDRVQSFSGTYTIDGNTPGYTNLVRDTWISEAAPATNYGGNSALSIRINSGYPDNANWSLIGFDLSALPTNSTVTSATMSLYLYSSGSMGGITVWRIRRPDWEEMQATWNVYKTGSSWTAGGCGNPSYDYATDGSVTVTGAAGPSWHNYPITALVQDAVSHRDAQLALKLTRVRDSSNCYYYSTEAANPVLKPKITINYTSSGTVQSSAATDIEDVSAILSGAVTASGGDSIDNYGFVWDAVPITLPSPVTSPSSRESSQLGGSWESGESIEEGEEFTYEVLGLRNDVTYYFRAGACLKDKWWVYGEQLDFKTLGGSIEGAPVLKVTVADVSGANVRLNGELLDDGGENCTVSLVWGLTNVGQVLGDWDIEGLPDEPEQPQAAGEFYRDIVVEANMIYYWSATAANSRGRSWAGVEVFAAFGGGGCDGAPMPPGSFTAAMDGADAIKLTWSKGEYADYTLIVMSRDDYPESVDGGDVIYYNTGTEHLMPVSELEDHGGYYFSGWGVNGCGQSEAYTKTTLAGGGLMANAMVMGVLCLLLMFASAFGDWRRFWPLIIIASLGWFFSAGWAMYLSLNAHDGYWVVAVVCIGMALATIMWPFIMKGPPPKIEELDEEAEAWGGKRKKRYPGRVDIE